MSESSGGNDTPEIQWEDSIQVNMLLLLEAYCKGQKNSDQFHRYRFYGISRVINMINNLG